ncbi:MAG: helix-turn-helix transcriptional regulator [Nostoc sp. ChiSLP01]|nr:helix-turn-helix transcriptional regulator [Nostoc sp. CmiSLP01]MDZ8282230.1 helix-turn-helix transcriptional regulator [Nostoc sp. ChiSLP01]
MNKLKQILQGRNLSEATLAEMLKTTKETIQLWKTGKIQIPTAALKDLAIILNCSVDEIMGVTEKRRSGYPSSFFASSDNKRSMDIISHYGGVTFHFQGVEGKFDYPIDRESAKSIDWYLQEPTDEPPHQFNWMDIETMNNYIIFVNLKILKICYLYTDDKEESPIFYHPEFYRVLTDWDILDELNPKIEDITATFDISETLAQAIQSIVNELKTQCDNWDSSEQFSSIKIYWLDGTQTLHYLDEQLYSNLESLRYIVGDPSLHPEAHLGTRFIQEYDEGGSTTFLNLEQIALIEVPAVKFWQMACASEPTLLELRDTSPYLPLKE